jgi:hypothetical protein
MKLKLIAMAIAMAASAQASAAIMTPIGGAGTNEVTFNIWDPTTQNSYTQDLGVTFNTFLANLNNASYTLNFAIDGAVYNEAFAGSNAADLIWDVSVASALALDYSNYTDFGLIGTSKTSFTLNDNALNGAITAHDYLATAMRGVNPADTNTADNNAYHGTVDNGAYVGTSAIWGTNWKGTPVNNTASIGEDMGFYYIQSDIITLTPTTYAAANNWSFDGSTISYGAVSAVPVPAAAWLFGSGLIGLVGVARRKNRNS